MDVINLKPYFLNRLLNWSAAITILGLAIIYWKINLSAENQTIVSGVFIAILFFFCLYLNRYDPKLIKLTDDSIEINYLGHPPYGKGMKIYAKNELNVLKEDCLITVSNKTGIVAKTRRKAVDNKDWKTLETYFN
jgi:hypothetical protein